MVDWTSLPPELVCLIADKLSAIEDLAAFISVCRSFNYAACRRRRQPVPRPPWLLLCCPDGEDDNAPGSGERGLLNMYKHKKKFYMNLPELQGRHCWGSRYGWIVTLGLDLQLQLFNPLSRRSITLPQPAYHQGWDEDGDGDDDWDDEDEKLNWIRKFYIDRALLIKMPPSCYSSSHYDDFLVVITGHLGQLRVIRPHNWAWVKFSGGNTPGCVFDIAYHNGQIYLLCIRASLYICSNFDGPDAPLVEQIMPLDMTSFLGDEKLYLVESLGDLLMVVRYLDALDEVNNYETSNFSIYKFDDKAKRWIQTEDLGGRVLFVGDCQSIALAPSEAVNCQSNSIYFTDDNYEHFKGKGGHDMGIFDFKEKTIKRFYDGADSLSIYSTPTWFIPGYT